MIETKRRGTGDFDMIASDHPGVNSRKSYTGSNCNVDQYGFWSFDGAKADNRGQY